MSQEPLEPELEDEGLPAPSVVLPNLHTADLASAEVKKKTYLEVYSLSEMMSIPKPDWLIKGVLPQSSVCMLAGMPGAGKTFVALDWALHVAMGRPWKGAETTQGGVLYICAEGRVSVAARVRAWCQYYGLGEEAIKELSRAIAFVAEPVNLMRPQMRDTLSYTADVSGIDHDEYPMRLVVIDTLARCIVGADENSAQDMGMAVSAVDILRDHEGSRLKGATFLLVHHVTKGGGDYERGSSAIAGALDTRIICKQFKKGVGSELTCTKQKDAAPFEPITIGYQEIAGSLVVDPHTAQDPLVGLAPTTKEKAVLTPREGLVLEIHAVAGVPLKMMACAEIFAKETGLNMNKVLGNMSKYRRDLIEMGYLERLPTKECIVTQAGLDLLAELQAQQEAAIPAPAETQK